MKYKDYYSILGIERSANQAEIKKAYRKLARRFHPDVSKEPDAEERFKEIAEAYNTLKDLEKRAAYDELGQQRPGRDFEPTPDWQQQYGEGQFSFDESDLADLFASLRSRDQGARRSRGSIPIPGQDYEVTVQIALEDAFTGKEVTLDLTIPEYDENGVVRRVPHEFKTRIPKGAADGQRLRVPGKGGKGSNGGRDGDLYLNIVLRSHPLFRVSGHDLYLDLPLAPWEAVLGTTVEVPTPGGSVRLKVPPGTQAGQQLRLSRRGLPKPRTDEGHLFAIVQIAVPRVISEQERALFRQLADSSTFNPRGHFQQEARNES